MLELISEHACFGGTQRFYRHQSSEIGLPMRFSVFLPPAAAKKPVPALFYLAGLTCNEETFMTKAGAQRIAAEEGLILIAPDTSPRGAGVLGETDNWDLGVGAGFYVDATVAPWNQHYRMYSYVLELYKLVLVEFPIEPSRVSVMGHSMGGHGALVLALRNPTLFSSVSALAPICAPSEAPWGEKCFGAYLGNDHQKWLDYDACALMAKRTTPFPGGILIDQGLADRFLQSQLYPHSFEQACKKAVQPVVIRRHQNYDHGYYFISTFIDEHLRFHSRQPGWPVTRQNIPADQIFALSQ
jgi:S-formylglutathione hydrolase